MENFAKLVSYLMHSRTQAHTFHLQTPSFAEHKALNDYYDEIVELVDGLIESYQGKYGIIREYVSFPLLNYTDKNQVVAYFEQLNQIIEQLRQDNDDSYIQNQIDGIVELVQSTLYKLKCLS
jgi:flagellar biosynthesis/type III secretory pathway chaperone